MKPKQGGKRKGAGRKKKYAEPTTTVAFRVPVSKIAEIKSHLENKLSQWKTK